MTPTEISFRLDINEMELTDDIRTVGNPARSAYYKGIAETAHDLRVNIKDAAIAGSPYSIAECQKQILNMLSEADI